MEFNIASPTRVPRGEHTDAMGLSPLLPSRKSAGSYRTSSTNFVDRLVDFGGVDYSGADGMSQGRDNTTLGLMIEHPTTFVRCG